MAFSMSQVKLKKKNRDIRMYFAVINQLDNISDNTKLILNTYLRSRVKKYGIPLCNEETWKYQLKGLLKYCCGKEYIDITAKDTDANKLELIHCLKNSLKVPNPKKLYIEKDKTDVNLYEHVNDNKPSKMVLNKGLSMEELQIYFES